jgi:hypothetical protein
MDALYINDMDEDIVESFYKKQNNKLGMKNVKINKIDQHRNAMCQM